MAEPVVRVTSGALDEFASGGRESIILRGVLDKDTINNILTGPYQREAMPVGPTNAIVVALGKGEAVPDIEVGMRGERFFSNDDTFTLRDPVYVIDGLQRLTAARFLLAHHPDANVRIGLLVHFNTDEPWERQRFAILNQNRTRVAASVLLKNLRHQNNYVLTLWGLCTADKDFALNGRVNWRQRAMRGDLLSAMTLLKTSMKLHSHYMPTQNFGSVGQVEQALKHLDANVKLSVFRDNTKTFFEVVDRAWGVRSIQHNMPTPHLRSGFLHTLAQVFSDHWNFWNEEGQLDVLTEDIKKLAMLDLRDPNVAALVGSQGASQRLLYSLIRDHLNSGRRIRMLQLRENAA